MEYISIPRTDLEVSQIIYGCMQIGGRWDKEPIPDRTRKEAVSIIQAAMDEGINYFDHADIYCYGKSEQAFAAIWVASPGLRPSLVIQSKCGIRFGGDPNEGSPHRFDFSYEHIIQSVEGSLQRLKTDYLDVLLLHRPDPLVEPGEVAKAFDYLHSSGKVRYFGVSNHTAAQISLLKRYINQPLITNQLELNVIHSHLLNAGVIFNQDLPAHPVRGEGTFEYCREHDISVQAWSPLALGAVTGKPIEESNEKLARVASLVRELADAKSVSPEAILIAWLLRIPENIQPVIGTTRVERIQASCQAMSITLSREEWYLLFTAGRGAPLP
jgi:predicted oxidoreductase